MGKPAVTVLMAVYNGEEYLREAVDSILAQTFSDFEFVIVNDGSADGSSEILRSYSDPRIRIVDNPVNIGIPRSVNKGLSLSSGKYIARMDSDDIAPPDRLKKEVEFLEVHPSVGVVSGSSQIIDEQGRSMDVIMYPRTPGYIKWCLLYFNPISNPAAMMRRDVVEQVGGYDNDYRVAQDYDLWCRLALVTRFANLGEIMVYHRMHRGRVSKKYSGDQYEFMLKSAGIYMSTLLGDSLPRDFTRMMMENRQGLMSETPDIIAKICQTVIADPTISAKDRKLIRKDAVKKMMYRYDLVRNTGRRAAISAAFSLDPIGCVVMTGYNIVYCLANVLGLVRR